MLFIMMMLRVGEAAHPGPWQIATANPTGIHGKADSFQELLPGVVGVSETHLTAPGAVRFKKELHMECPGARFNGGAPVDPKYGSVGGMGGKYSGVGFISSFPMRSLPGGWDAQVGNEHRIHCAHMWVQNQWITGGIMYGPAHQADSPEVRDHADSLLTQVIQKVCMWRFQPNPGETEDFESSREVRMGRGTDLAETSHRS